MMALCSMDQFSSQKWQLFALKMVVFCWFAATACLLPYMTIHMRKLGITVEETAIVYTVLPFMQVIGSPVAGFIADRIGNYKPVLSVALILSILTSLALMVIPSSGDPDHYVNREEYVRHQVVFWLYFVIRIVFAIANGVCFSLLDATAIALSKKHNTTFGKVRFWGILGTGLFSPVCGWLVDLLSDGLGEFDTNYSPTFHFFNFFVLLTLLSSAILNIEVAASETNWLRDLKHLLRWFPIWIFLAVIFIIGTCWGFVESFLFLYLLDLKAPKMLLGFTLTTGAIISLPFLQTSDWFVKKLGHSNLMILALLFYFIRFYGYSLIESPYWCFPFEAMEVFTYHLMWVAATICSSELAPEGLQATMIGAVGSLHYGIGRASGSMIGGTLMAVFSTRLAFRIFGIGAGISTIFYSIYYFCYLRNQSHFQQQKENKDCKLEETRTQNEAKVQLQCTVVPEENNSVCPSTVVTNSNGCRTVESIEMTVITDTNG